MQTKYILDTDYQGLTISSLPSNPTAKVNYGGLGYSANDMKAAFDALPLFIIDRLNSLITDISEPIPEDSISGTIKTGIGGESHTLADLFADITSGAIASYLTVGENSLASEIAKIRERLDALDGGGYE